MGKAITVRGKTVEQAVEAALGILGLELQDVHIHVAQTAETGGSPDRSRFAEVVVTPVRYQLLDSGTPDGRTASGGACITAGRVEVHAEEGDALPTIEAGPGVQVVVNGRKTEGRTELTAADLVHLRTIDELTRAQLSITIREQGALALLSVTPGVKITRTVKDAPLTDRLCAEALEIRETVNDLSQQMIREACGQLGITAALDKRVLWEACETDVPYEAIIARGTFPKPGLDGDIEVQIDVDGESLLEEEARIDYREKTAVQLVQKGQLVAAVLPPVPGQPGTDVFGSEIPAENGVPAVIRLGKNVMRSGNHLFAECPGKLSIVRQDGTVSVDIADSIEVAEVNLASGNLRFDGDVTVTGGVTQGCAVRVSGSADIHGDVRKGEVWAGRGIRIGGHISSSRLEAGRQLSADTRYAGGLAPILPDLQSLAAVTRLVASLQQREVGDLDGQELKKVFRTSFGENYDAFRERLQAFLQLRPDEETGTEWKDLQAALYNLFVNTLHPGVEGGKEFLALIRSAQQLHDRHRPAAGPQASELVLPYAVNSSLYCAGTIRVTGQGLAQCDVHAAGDLLVEGVCRGGDLTGERSVSIRECGSKRGVQTIVRTGHEGTIVIGIAYPGTVLYVGEASRRIAELQIGITAKVTDGLLTVR